MQEHDKQNVEQIGLILALCKVKIYPSIRLVEDILNLPTLDKKIWSAGAREHWLQ